MTKHVFLKSILLSFIVTASASSTLIRGYSAFRLFCSKVAGIRRYSTVTYYNMLNVERTDTSHTIRKSFLRLALKTHPDVDKSPRAGEKFKQIKEAYEVLKDTKRRAKYDESLDKAPQQQAFNTNANFSFRINNNEENNNCIKGAYSKKRDFNSKYFNSNKVDIEQYEKLRNRYEARQKKKRRKSKQYYSDSWRLDLI